jgi:ribA/ribD-fused uncharacterized protein
MIRTARRTLFFGAQDPLSNWHPAPFTLRTIAFTAEHFMMYCKARLFEDAEAAAAILGDNAAARRLLAGTPFATRAAWPAGDPSRAKALGRAVRGFERAAWEDRCRGYVKAGARAKFTQNPALLRILLSTAGTQLVEASPSDRIWGVGLRATDPRIHHPAQWLGENRLGLLLTQLRDELLRHVPARAAAGPHRV